MLRKLIVRLLIVGTYFTLDVLYTIWKQEGNIELGTLIEKGVLFIGLGLAVYILTIKATQNDKQND